MRRRDRVEAIDRLEQRQARHLEDIVEGLARPRVADGELPSEREEALDHDVAVDRIAIVAEPLEQTTVGMQAVDRRGSRSGRIHGGSAGGGRGHGSGAVWWQLRSRARGCVAPTCCSYR
jgi:hypothetical protein